MRCGNGSASQNLACLNDFMHSEEQWFESCCKPSSAAGDLLLPFQGSESRNGSLEKWFYLKLTKH